MTFSLKNYNLFSLWDFGWCQTCLYSFTNISTDSKKIIHAFINSDSYKSTYICPFEKEEHKGNVHGPFKINSIKVRHYVNLNKNEFLFIINNIYKELHAPPSSDQIYKINEYISSIGFDKIKKYYLNIKFNDKKYTHDLGWVLTVFHDFILINNEDSKLYHIVFGFD